MATMFATNGLNMTEKLASELVEAGLKQIRFSLDGPRKIHNRIRGREDAFDRLLQVIELVHRADKTNQVSKIINTTISSMNIHSVEEVIDVARQSRVEYVHVFLVSVVKADVARQANEIFGTDVVYGRSLLDDGVLIREPDLIQRKRDQLLTSARERFVRIYKSTFFTLPVSDVVAGIKRRPGPCSRVYDSCLIDSHGNVFPCEYLRYKFGDIRSQALRDILAGDNAKRFARIYSENGNRSRVPVRVGARGPAGAGSGR
jgi:MoaA/NifB/PqqE/SkfB family radical SAM enzyme